MRAVRSARVTGRPVGGWLTPAELYDAKTAAQIAADACERRAAGDRTTCAHPDFAELAGRLDGRVEVIPTGDEATTPPAAAARGRVLARVYEAVGGGPFDDPAAGMVYAIADLLHAAAADAGIHPDDVLARAAAHAHQESADGALRPTWTVTVAGRERHIGEKPFTYCLYAPSVEAAIAHARNYHARLYEDIDLIMTEVYPGPPLSAVPYFWNDLRDLQDGKETPRTPQERHTEEWFAYNSLPYISTGGGGGVPVATAPHGDVALPDGVDPDHVLDPHVPLDDASCPACGGTDLRERGDGSGIVECRGTRCHAELYRPVDPRPASGRSSGEVPDGQAD